MRLSRLAAAVPVILACLGCQAQPVTGRVEVAGDSIALQAAYFTGSWPDVDAAYLDLGARASTHQTVVAADVADTARSPAVLIMAYGHNYVPTGFTAADRAELERMVFAPHPTACTVLVLPDYTGPDTARQWIIGAYRLWAGSLADAQPDRIVLADWQAASAGHPEWIAPDGIHLSGDVAAATAFIQVAMDATATCP